MARDDYFVIMYAILEYFYISLKKGQKVDVDKISSSAFGVNERYWRRIISDMVEKRMISGVIIAKSKDGILINGFENAEITFDGVEYLHSNSMIEKVKGTMIDIKNIIPFI